MSMPKLWNLAVVFVLWPVVGMAQTSGGLWAEAQVSAASPYVQQSVVYTVRVVSRTNLATLDVDAPTVMGAALERLDEKPRSYARMLGGRQWVVNEYRYALTPLLPGTIEIPATRLSGTIAGGARTGSYGQYYDSWQDTSGSSSFDVSTKPITLQARPAATHDQPWLPLQGLSLQGQWGKGKDQAVRLGEPLRLTLVLWAVGAGGDRLPSLAALMESEDFKVYTERAPQTRRWVSTDGGAVRGWREETLTLIPQRTGKLQLPGLRLPWWDVTHDRLAWAEWPSSEVVVQGAADGSEGAEQSGGGFVRAALRSYWLAPAILVAFLVGLWVGRRRPGVGDGRSRMASVALRLAEDWRTVAARLDTTGRRLRRAVPVERFTERMRRYRPQHLVQRMQQRLEASLPAGTKARRLLRRVQGAATPLSIERDLQAYGHSALRLARHAPLPVIAASLAAARPRIDASSLRALFRELDAAVYGGAELQLVEWKRRFRRLFRPMLRRAPSTTLGPGEGGLPPLNPTHPAGVLGVR